MDSFPERRGGGGGGGGGGGWGVSFPAVQKHQTPLPLSLVHLPIIGPYSLWNMRNYLGMTISGLPVKQTSPQNYIKRSYKPNFEKEL